MKTSLLGHFGHDHLWGVPRGEYPGKKKRKQPNTQTALVSALNSPVSAQSLPSFRFPNTAHPKECEAPFFSGFLAVVRERYRHHEYND